MIYFIMQITLISFLCWFVIVCFKKQSADWKQKFILSGLTACLLVPAMKLFPVSFSTIAPESTTLTVISSEEIIRQYVPKSNFSKKDTHVPAVEKQQKSSVHSSEVSNLNWWLVIWSSGVSILLLRLLHQLMKLRKEKAKSIFFKNHKRLQVYVSKTLEVPLLYSLGKALVIIPSEMIHRETWELNHILNHEFCHFQRKDHWQLWLTTIISILFWFHPLIHLLIKRHRSYTEMACDRDMLLAGTDPVEYASVLISCVKIKNRAPILASMSTQPKLIEQRLDTLMQISNLRLSKSNWLIISLLVLIMIAASVSWNPEKWVSSEYFIDDIEYDLPSIRNSNPPPGEMHVSVLYDGVENKSSFIRMKLSNESESSWIKLGPLKKFNNYIHTWHIKLKNNARFTGEYEIVGAEADGVVDGVGVGVIGTDFDGQFRIMKSKSVINGKIPNIICSWPLGLFDEEFITALPQLKTDNPDSVKRLLCGAQLVGNGIHKLN